MQRRTNKKAGVKLTHAVFLVLCRYPHVCARRLYVSGRSGSERQAFDAGERILLTRFAPVRVASHCFGSRERERAAAAAAAAAATRCGAASRCLHGPSEISARLRHD